MKTDIIKDGIELTSRPHKVAMVTTTTQARLFKDFVRGTTFIVQVQLKNTRGGANGLYSLKVIVTNLTTGEKDIFSQNEVLKYLKCFELEEI